MLQSQSFVISCIKRSICQMIEILKTGNPVIDFMILSLSSLIYSANLLVLFSG